MATRVAAVDGAGSDTLGSEISQNRSPTHPSEFDDHRQRTPASVRVLPESGSDPKNVPKPSPHQAAQHAHSGHLTPELLQILAQTHKSVPVSRDFEHAIIDDEGSLREELRNEALDSMSPNPPRRGRQSRAVPGISRDSSLSERSSSPANSVDAFANPRRRERANTIGSRPNSDVETGLNRTISGGTHHRRPTFNNGSVREPTIIDDRASFRCPTVEEICFAEDEAIHKTAKIDFEELDEFVAERRRIRQNARGWQKLSFSSHGDKPKVFHPHAKWIQQASNAVSNDQDGSKSSSECAVDDSDGVLDEKLHAQHGITAAPTVTQVGVDGKNTRFSFFSSELEKTVHAAEFGDLLGPEDNFRDLFDLPPSSGVWWLDVMNPTEDELQAFQRAFGIHRLTTEDIMTQETREKVELFKAYYFVCFRSFHHVNDKDEDHMEPLNVYMVVFREGIISITYTQSPHAGNVRKRIGKLRDYMALTADWICYAMIDNIVDTFGPPIHTIEVEADTIEDQVFVARNDDFGPLLRQIGNSRRKVMSLMRLLGGKADVIKGFAKRCNEQYSVTPRGEIGLYLGDIQDHVVTMMSNLGHFEKMLSRSHSNYLAQLSVDHIAQGNRANKVLSKITLLASILVPLNLICGLFGMNVPVPGRSSTGLGWFFGIIGGIAAFTIIALAFARRYRFL